MNEFLDNEPTNPDAQIGRDHILSNWVYDKLKFLAQIVLPALGALYFTLANLWGLPAATQVVGSIAAIDTFFGAVLLVSTKSYNNSDAKFDGAIKVTDSPNGKRVFNLHLDGDPADIPDMDEVLFKVDSTRLN